MQRIIRFDDVRKKETKEQNPNWTKNSDHTYRIFIIGDSGAGETNSLFNLIRQQPDFNKVYLCDKDLYDSSSKVCFPNKKEDLNLSVFNIFTRTIESKTLTKYMSCKLKCKCDGRKCDSN